MMTSTVSPSIMDNATVQKLTLPELSLKLGATAHKILDVGLLNELATSSLTRDSIPVPDYDANAQGIPNTFVPEEIFFS